VFGLARGGKGGCPLVLWKEYKGGGAAGPPGQGPAELCSGAGALRPPPGSEGSDGVIRTLFGRAAAQCWSGPTHPAGRDARPPTVGGKTPAGHSGGPDRRPPAHKARQPPDVQDASGPEQARRAGKRGPAKGGRRHRGRCPCLGRQVVEGGNGPKRPPGGRAGGGGRSKFAIWETGGRGKKLRPRDGPKRLVKRGSQPAAQGVLQVEGRESRSTRG